MMHGETNIKYLNEMGNRKAEGMSPHCILTRHPSFTDITVVSSKCCRDDKLLTHLYIMDGNVRLRSCEIL